MDFENIQLERIGETGRIRLHRPGSRNSINLGMLEELDAVFRALETDPAIKVIVLQGHPEFFCTGMDFRESMRTGPGTEDQEEDAFPARYGKLLKAVSLCPKIVIGNVSGQTLAGGMGLLAVCDYVIAHPESRFGLSEMLWGLLPSMVAPYLIRKVGFRAAYKITLGTAPIDCEAARQIMLVDEITTDPDAALARLIRRYGKLEGGTIARMKLYFREMWIIDEAMESRACRETSQLMQDPLVTENIRNFVLHGRYPWERQEAV
jgi:polyketide biosynthesis enoyl-CoA hydratase PksH